MNELIRLNNFKGSTCNVNHINLFPIFPSVNAQISAINDILNWSSASR